MSGVRKNVDFRHLSRRIVSLKQCKIGSKLLLSTIGIRAFDWYQNRWPWMTSERESTVWIVLYSGFARFALLLHASSKFSQASLHYFVKFISSWHCRNTSADSSAKIIRGIAKFVIRHRPRPNKSRTVREKILCALKPITRNRTARRENKEDYQKMKINCHSLAVRSHKEFLFLEGKNLL